MGNKGSRLNCVPCLHVKILSPILQNVTLFGHKDFKEVGKLKCGVRWSLIQCDWHLYNKRNGYTEAREVGPQRKGH